MIRRYMILVSGFRQDHRRLTGMDVLLQSLLPFQAPDSWLDYVPWDHDMAGLAAFMHRHAALDAEINVAAYSWGAGRGAVRLAEELRERGRRVSRMVLCDPVYRRPWVPTWFNALPWSLTEGRTIRFPATVDQVEWFYQRNDKPAGHRPVGARIISGGVELPYTHAGMEDSAEFHQAVRDVVGV